MPEKGLAERVKDGLLKKTGPAEARRKRVIQGAGYVLGAGGPIQIPMGPFGQLGGGKKSAFHGHGHPVARKRRDHGEGIAHADTGLCRGPAGAQGKSRDAGE